MNNKNFSAPGEISLGLRMALAENPKAKEHFFSLSEDEKQYIIREFHNLNSKQEAERFINGMLGY